MQNNNIINHAIDHAALLEDIDDIMGVLPTELPSLSHSICAAELPNTLSAAQQHPCEVARQAIVSHSNFTLADHIPNGALLNPNGTPAAPPLLGLRELHLQKQQSLTKSKKDYPLVFPPPECSQQVEDGNGVESANNIPTAAAHDVQTQHIADASCPANPASPPSPPPQHPTPNLNNHPATPHAIILNT